VTDFEQYVTFCHVLNMLDEALLLLDNYQFHINNDERLVSKMEGKLIFRGTYTGCQELEFLSVWKSLTYGVGHNVKQFDGLT